MTIRTLPLLVALLTVAARPLHAQILETETARLLPAHAWKVGGNVEWQWSREGGEGALPFAIEYGLSRRLELMVEPVAYTAIRPKQGMRASGLGDLEMTATFLVRPESGGTPGFAVAAEVKIPTAGNSLIGTRKTDYAGYLIASQHLGPADLHINLSYTQPGSPAGTPLRGVFGGAIAVMWHLTPRTDLFAEALASTSASASENPEGSTTPEVAGSEAVGTLGFARRFGAAFQRALSISYDNNGAVLLRPGIVYRVK
jgi:hypothetical protein